MGWFSATQAADLQWEPLKGNAGTMLVENGALKLELVKPGSVSGSLLKVPVRSGRRSTVSFEYSGQGLSEVIPLSLSVKWMDATGKNIDAVRMQLNFPPLARNWQFPKSSNTPIPISDNVSVPDEAVSALVQFEVRRSVEASSGADAVRAVIAKFTIQEGERSVVGIETVKSGMQDAGPLSVKPVGVRFGTNLVSNAALEEGTDHPVGWKIEGDNSNGSVEWMKGGAFSGKYAFKLNDRGSYVKSWDRQPGDPFVPGGKPTGNTASAREEVSARWVSTPVPAEPGKAYQVTAFYWYANHSYLDRGVANPIRIQFLNARGDVLSYQTIWDDWFPQGKNGNGCKAIQQIGWNFCISKPVVAPNDSASLRVAVVMPHAFCDISMGTLRHWTDDRGFVLIDNISAFQVPDGSDLKDAQKTYEEALAAGMVPFVPTSPRYRPNTIEVKTQSDLPGGLLLKEENGPILGEFSLQFTNRLGDSRSGMLHYELIGVDDKAVQQGKTPIQLNPFGIANVTIDLSKNIPLGPYVVRYSLAMDNESKEGAVTGAVSCGFGAARKTAVEERSRMDYPFSLWMPEFESTLDTPKEAILGKLAENAGMGKTWFGGNLYTGDYVGITDLVKRQDAINKEIAKARVLIAAWKKYGVTPMGHTEPPGKVLDPLLYPVLAEMTQSFVTALKDQIKVWRNGTEHMHGGVQDLDVAKAEDGRNYLYWGRTGTVRQYWQEYLVMYVAAKQADPGCLFGPSCASDVNGDVLRLFFQVLGKKDMDIFGTNTYISAFSIWPSNEVQLAKNGAADLPVFSSEFSAQAGTSPSASDHTKKEIEASSRMVEYWASILYAFPRLFHLEQWGMMLGDDDASLTYHDQIRPQYLAYANMTNLFGAGKITAKYDTQGASVYVRKYSIRRGYVALAWAKSSALAMDFQINSKSALVYDVWGNCREVAATDGVISLELSDSPSYIVSQGEVKPAASIGIIIEHATIQADKPAIRVVLTNLLKTPISGAMEIIVNGPLKLGQRKFEVRELAPQKSSETIIPAQLLGELRDRRLNIIVRFTTDKKVYEVPASLNFTFARKISSPVDGGASKWSPAEWGMIADREDQFSQWNSPKAWLGPDDISVRAGFRWDQKYLYTVFNVTDDVFSPPENSTAIWQHDLIEILVDVNRTLVQGDGFTMFGLVAFPSGPKILRFDGALPKGEVPGSKICVKQNGHIVTYEAAIPWNEIQRDFTPKVGQVISTAWSADDHDGGNSGRRCISWFSAVNDKNPAKFGDVVLCD